MAWVISSWMAKISVRVAIVTLRPKVAAISPVNQLTGNADRAPAFADAAFNDKITPQRSPDFLHIHMLALVGVDGVARHHTQPDTFDRSVMMSSVMPSLKYSCSGSPLMLTNGRTAMDGRSLPGLDAAPGSLGGGDRLEML